MQIRQKTILSSAILLSVCCTFLTGKPLLTPTPERSAKWTMTAAEFPAQTTTPTETAIPTVTEPATRTRTPRPSRTPAPTSVSGVSMTDVCRKGVDGFASLKKNLKTPDHFETG